MKELIELIRVLRPGERALVHHQYARVTNNEDKLRLRLFVIAEKGLAKTDAEAIKQLGTTSGRSAFSHLKKRLKEDMLNAILLQDPSKRFVEPFRIAAFDCRKKLAQAYVLIMRGEQVSGKALLREAGLIADKYELVLESVQINSLIRETLHGIKKPAQLRAINKKLDTDLQKLEVLFKVEGRSLMLNAPSLFDDDELKEAKETFSINMEAMEQAYAKTGMARVGFWYLRSRTEYHNSKLEFSQVLSYGAQLLHLVENSLAIRNKPNIAGANQTIGLAHFNLCQYAKAEEHLTQSLINFRAGGLNQFNCLQFVFRAQLQNEQYAEAALTLAQALNHPWAKKEEVNIARLQYFNSVLLLRSGQTDAVYRTVQRSIGLQRERDEWNIHHRFMEMVVEVEKEDLDGLDYTVNTARKFLSRNTKLRTPRVKLILQFFAAVVHRGLDNMANDKAIATIIKQLGSDAVDMRWNAMGPEILRIDEWWNRKMAAMA